MSRVCDQVRVVRNKKNISQEYMASVIGIDTSSYHRLEKGNSPITFDRLEKIAEVLGVTLHTLVCGDDHMSSESLPSTEYLHHLKQEVAFLRKQLQDKEAQLSMLLESKIDPFRSATNPLR
jgi:transcriptional regulator with XRE-family HTH domain